MSPVWHTVWTGTPDWTELAKWFPSSTCCVPKSHTSVEPQSLDSPWSVYYSWLGSCYITLLLGRRQFRITFKLQAISVQLSWLRYGLSWDGVSLCTRWSIVYSRSISVGAFSIWSPFFQRAPKQAVLLQFELRNLSRYLSCTTVAGHVSFSFFAPEAASIACKWAAKPSILTLSLFLAEN